MTKNDVESLYDQAARTIIVRRFRTHRIYEVTAKRGGRVWLAPMGGFNTDRSAPRLIVTERELNVNYRLWGRVLV